MKIGIVNGPNLNLLGKREPQIYGGQSFESYLKELQHEFSALAIDFRQANGEAELIEAIQQGGATNELLIINAAAYSHTSLAVADAARAIAKPYIEVHISNVHQREAFRQHSYLSAGASGIIVGFGLPGYRLALLAAIAVLDQKS